MEDEREVRLSNERILRGIFGIFLIILIVNVAAWYAKPYITWILVSVVTYLVFFNLKYVFIDHKTYSLSSVTSSTELIVSTALTSGIALLISWLILFLGTKAHRLKSLQ